MVKHRHRSPSQDEYDKRNPPITVRLTRDMRNVLDRVRGDRPYSQATKDILVEKLKPGVELLAQLERMRRENEALKTGVKNDVVAMYSRMFGRHTRD